MKVKLFIAVVVAVVVIFLNGGTAMATIPLTKSQPFQEVCEAQGGVFEVATDLRSLYCTKAGGLFTAFTDEQLAVQRTICERVYGAFFGVQGVFPDLTGTFCSTAT